MQQSNVIRQWVEDASNLLTELQGIDLGYPQGENAIRTPSQLALESDTIVGISAVGLRDELLAFYGSCDGLSWPDVHNGIFVESVERLSCAKERGEPDKLVVRDSDQIIRILVIGSDGGGNRFCIDESNGRVWRVSGGLLENRVLEADSKTVVLVAASFLQFLNRLREDLRAFINGDQEHQFVT